MYGDSIKCGKYKRIRIGILMLILISSGLIFLFSYKQTVKAQESAHEAVLEPEVIRVAYDPSLPPFQFHKNGIPLGFNVDILKAVSKSQNFQVRLYPMYLHESVEALKQGQIDGILGIYFNANFDEMEFTERFLNSSVSMLVPRNESGIDNMSDLSERIVAIQKDTLEYDLLRNIRRIKYHVTSNQVDAFQLLRLGRADAYVGNRKTAEYLLEQYGLEDHYTFVERYILPLEYTMAVPRQNPSLLQKINRGLHQIKVDGTYKQVYDQWFQDENLSLQHKLRRMIQLFVMIGLLAGILFLLGMRWNRQLKKESRNSQRLKEQILDSSPRGIVTIDRNGRITSINSKAIDLTNLDVKPLGQPYEEIKLLSTLLAGKHEQVLEQGKQFHGEEKTNLSSDSDERYLRYYVYPLYDFKQNISGTILSFEDVTEERKLREQVFQQEKSSALTQLVAGVAHEIRNPMTSIKAFVELIPYKVNQPRFQQELVTHVPKEIERLNHLVEELINYAKPTSSQRETINVTELIQSCVVLFTRMIEDKGYSLSMELESNLYIEADQNQIKQVLINLILNSIEALDEKKKAPKKEVTVLNGNSGSLIIRATSIGHHREPLTIIQVQDNGIGIEEAQLKRVTEPFFTTKAQGTGLGLSLSQQYIQENGGKMHIESKKDQGTTVTLSFRKAGDQHGQAVNY